MPIYEFYCSDCHALFHFFSARVDTERRPSCPRCRAPELERRPATFATLSQAEEGGADDPREVAVERAMTELAGEIEAEGGADDPRRMARLMRRFGESSGLEMGPELESALARLEAGEDPEDVESAFDDLPDEDTGFEELFRLRRTAGVRRSRPPIVDDELYFL